MAKANTAEDRGGALVLQAPGGTLRNLVKKEIDVTSETRKVVGALVEDYPHLAELLGGSPSQGEFEAVPGSAITFWVSPDGIKWSTNVKSLGKTFKGMVSDPLNPWGSVNCALAMGDCSQSDYTERNPSSSSDPKNVPVY